MSMVKRIMNVGGLTLGSRVLGMFRDVLMASALGTTMAADAFFIAFKLPNFFRRLFAEGAFSASFVPLFARRLGVNGDGRGQHRALNFASQVLGVFVPTLFIVLVLFELAMPAIMYVLTGGFADGELEKFELVVHLGRLTFPYLMLISLVTLYSGVMNGLGRFSAAAAAPMLLNVSMITALLFWDEGPLMTAEALAASIAVAGLLQLLWLVFSARKAGIVIRLPRPRLTPGVKEMLRVAAPAAIGAGVMQINLLIDLLIAARLLPEGSVSYLFYADRLNQLPIGVIGVAIGTVLLPSISRALGAGDKATAIKEQNRAMEFALFLTLPFAAGLMIVAEPILGTIFERGAFTAADTQAAAAALVAYATGLPAYIVVKILTPAFFARKDTKTPVMFAIISLVVNVVLNLLLYKPYGHVGLAIATSIAAWLNVVMLYLYLRHHGNFVADKQLFVRTGKALAATAVTIVALYYIEPWATPLVHSGGLWRFLSITALILGGAAVYFITAALLKTIPRKEMRAFLKRGA